MIGCGQIKQWKAVSTVQVFKNDWMRSIKQWKAVSTVQVFKNDWMRSIKQWEAVSTVQVFKNDWMRSIKQWEAVSTVQVFKNDWMRSIKQWEAVSTVQVFKNDWIWGRIISSISVSVSSQDGVVELEKPLDVVPRLFSILPRLPWNSVGLILKTCFFRHRGVGRRHASF